jgi:hypothetical protein
MRDLIKLEKLTILLLQETKLKVNKVLRIFEMHWSNMSEGTMVSSKGASRNIFTLWDISSP